MARKVQVKRRKPGISRVFISEIVQNMAKSSQRAPTRKLSEQSKDNSEQVATRSTPPPQTPRSTRVLYIFKALAIIVLAAAYSPISQLTLSPVYGSVGASVYHNKGLILTSLFTILARGEVANYLPTDLGFTIPIFAFWIPTIQYVLFQYSTGLGNPNGAFWTDCLTCFPLVALSLYVALQYIDAAALKSFEVGGTDISIPAGSFLLFALAIRAMKGLIFNNVGRYIFTTRIGMQMIVAILYASLLPSNLLMLSIPSVAFTTLGNVHAPLERTTSVLNDTLALYNYTLLERRESLTGYISVIENRELKFRAMRCDHSLLGGEWVVPSQRGQKAQVREPIYAIFAMLEAVRLVKTDGNRAEKQKALNIGLGVGTAPTAMMAHGIQTDVIELDPIVYHFAAKYFGLAPGLVTQIGDAVESVQKQIDRDVSQTYDYIIHDVFTGGAEPISLFTIEFLSNLKSLLKANGVIAINYAGDLTMPAASLIYRTVSSVFPSCRVFREVEAPTVGSSTGDFTNMVFFCTRSPNAIEFREPVEKDFLGSGARQEHLLPKHEIPAEKFQRDGYVLSTRNSSSAKELEKWQVRSAIGHWKLMRTVIPPAVWENW